MKNFILFFAFIFSFEMSFSQEDSVLLSGASEYKIRKIFIDPGHGGKDPGALGKKSRESDIALSIALKVGAYLEKNLADVKIVYSRKTDIHVELDKRAELANEQKADLFVSIHVNASRKKNVFGTATYVMGLHKSQDNLDVAVLENSVIELEENFQTRYAISNPQSVDNYIIANFKQNTHLDQSVRLANKIQKEFRERAGRNDLGVRQAGFLVLWNTTMPAVLVETGFISNSQEEKYLMTEKGQDFIASAIFRAIRDYKNDVEKKNPPKKNEKKDKKNNQDEKKGKILFKIQIAASKIKLPLNSVDFKGISDVEENEGDDGMFRYTTEKTSDFAEAEKLLKKVQKKIPKAFIVAYKNGKKMNIDEAKKESQKK